MSNKRKSTKKTAPVENVETVGETTAITEQPIENTETVTIGEIMEQVAEEMKDVLPQIEEHPADVQAMIDGAAEAIEQFGDDALEAYAAEKSVEPIDTLIEDLSFGDIETIEQNVPDVVESVTEEIEDLTLPHHEIEDAAIEATLEARDATEDTVENTATFEDVLSAVSDEEADSMINRVMRLLDERAAFELAKNGDNNTIQNSIKRARKWLAGREQGRVLVACGFNETDLMRERHAGSKYNVYAYLKLADIVAGLNGSDRKISNAVNVACMKSLFMTRRAGIAFNKKIAEACVSKNIRIDAALNRHLMRHTASEATASTQASSTMQALQTLGVVEAIGGRNPTYQVRPTAIAKKLESVMLAA